MAKRVKYSVAEVNDPSGRRKVMSRTTAAPPAHVAGDVYLVPSGATGDWSSHVGELAGSDGSAWIYEAAPPAGLRIVVEDEGIELLRGGSAFAPTSAKNNWAATSAPGASDDETSGYSVGSRWIDVAANKEYCCTDPSEDGATWKDTTLGGGAITYSEITATADTTTTSGTPATINGMTTTPASGTYLVSFSASLEHTSGAADATYAVYKAGTVVAHTERNFGWAGGAHTGGLNNAAHTQGFIAVNGSQAIEIKWQRGSTGTFKSHERSMVLIKVA